MGRDNNSGTTLTITDFLSLILSKFVELRVLTSDEDVRDQNGKPLKSLPYFCYFHTILTPSQDSEILKSSCPTATTFMSS